MSVPMRYTTFGWIVALVLTLVVAAGGAAAGGDGLERARQAQERHTGALLSRPGIVGTALGRDAAGNAVIQVFVAGPGVVGVPSTLDGVSVRTVVTGEIRAQDDESTVYPQPVPIGVSSSNVNSVQRPFCYTGTLGARLVDPAGAGYGLSNNHVYANTNGTNGAGPGSDVIQPGIGDNGCTASGTNRIGTLHAYVPIDFSGGDNRVDAAIAKDAGTGGSPAIGTSTPPDGYGQPSKTALVCENDACGNLLGTPVQKRGRTTHLTTGSITGVNATVTVDYGRGQKARFVDQLIVGTGSFSASGDSGSLVVTHDAGAHPVGLLFAGSSSTTVLNRIDLVFSELATNVVGSPVTGLSVDGKSATASPSPSPTPTATPTPSPSPSPTPTATPASLTVTAITPAEMTPGSTVPATITGSGFTAGATVTFENGQGPAPTATNVVVVDASTITADVVVPQGGPPRSRSWDVVVTLASGSSASCSGCLVVRP